MYKLFSKIGMTLALAILSSTSYAQGWDCEPACSCDRAYIGGFGGELFSNSSKINQMGTAFFSEVDSIGPLAINAEGKSKKTSQGFGGFQIGYEWANCPLNIGCSNFSLTPALEVEAFWYNHNRKGHLINPTTAIPEHDFADSFKLDNTVFMVNGILALDDCRFWGLSPYVGGGIGAVHISLKRAKSFQVSPVEPGINHFNSRRHDTTWAFAGQIKAGVRYKICQALHLFAEYRYLFIDSSNFILGSTNYPTHVPTSPWNVKLHDIHYNAFAIGLQYDFQ